MIDIFTIMTNLKIKLFADGADLNSILSLAKDDRIKGFTTNPTLMRKAGVTDYRSFAKEVLSNIKDKPISFEVFADELDEMETQAHQIASWADNVYVKIPITNTKGEPTSKIVSRLSDSGVKVNVTGVFTLSQISEAANAVRGKTPAVISVFAGRIADTGINPTPIMIKALEICSRSGFAVDGTSKNTKPVNESNIELLWASPRELYNIIEANNAGCHIITVASDVLSKLDNLGKDLTQFSLETVQMFYNDAKKAGYSL